MYYRFFVLFKKTHYASKIQWKVGNRSVLLGTVCLPAMSRIQREVKKKTQRHLTVSATVVGSTPILGNRLFLFSRSGNKTKRGVEFLNSTCYISKISNECLVSFMLYANRA